MSWFHSAACLEVGGVLYLKKNRKLDGQIDLEKEHSDSVDRLTFDKPVLSAYCMQMLC